MNDHPRGQVSTAERQGADPPPEGARKIGARFFVPTFATSLVIQACTVAQGILLARVLGTEGRGQFAAAILWPGFFAAAGSLGTTVALSRRAARARDLSSVMRAAILLALCTGGFTALVCAAAQWLLLSDADTTIHTAAYVFLLFIPFNHLALALGAVDHGAGRVAEFNWMRLLVNPLYLTLAVALWLAGVVDVVWFVTALMLSTVAVAFVRLGLAARQAPLLGPALPLRRVFAEGLPFGAVGLLTPVLQTADKALLLHLLGPAQLGLYVVALTASTVINSVATSASAVTFGMAAQARPREGFEDVARMFRMTCWLWLLGGAALAAVMPWLLPLIFGPDFAAAVLPAVVLIPGAAFAGQASVLEEALRGQGRALVGLQGRLAGLLVLVVAGWILALRWGALGVALANNAAQALVLVVMIHSVLAHFTDANITHLLPRAHDFGALQAYLTQRLPILARLNKRFSHP